MITKETKILFFDTETSNFIKKALTADDPDQAWVVQIGAILATQEKELNKMNTIIQSNGRPMGYYAEKVHGISVDKADEEGIIEYKAVEEFGLLLSQAELIVGHNFTFDWQFVTQMFERNMDKLSDIARSSFYLDTPNFCTMKDKTVKNYVNVKNKKGQIKYPKLIELHKKLFKVGFDNAHDAFVDITATKNCFFELCKRNLIKIK